MSEIVLLSDARIAALPVDECGEAMVDVRTCPTVAMDDRLADPDGAYAMVREGVAARLVLAQRQLPAGWQLALVEGYRPIELQRRYFAEYRDGLAAQNPTWPADRLREQASRYISPPEVAPHVAGAAVDVTLLGADGAPAWMGTPINATPEESEGACFTAAPGVDIEARRNRAALIGALTAVGFVNYPTEWWHWSYGDRYWAFATGARAARYGPVSDLPKAHWSAARQRRTL